MARTRLTDGLLTTPTGRARLLAAAGMTSLLGGLVAVVAMSGSTHTARPATTATVASVAKRKTPAPSRRRPKVVRVEVIGVGAYDPEGDGSENGDRARLAADGNRATAWTSERYRSVFTKSGVGLVLDARRPVRARRVTVATATPGFEAQVRAGGSVKGPFAAVSGVESVTGRTTFELRPRRSRYLVLWITSMPPGGVAAVNEVDVTAQG